MLPGPCYLISDAHLGVASRDAERALVGFLSHVNEHAGSLVVNGDLFDFWFEWSWVIPRIGYRVIAALAAIAERGTPVIWIAGNHDCWGGSFLRDDVGLQYVVGCWRGDAAGWRLRVEHGDGLRGAADRRYRLVRPILRNRAAMWAYRNLLHPDWASRLALGTSATSRTYSAADNGEGLKAVAFRDLAGDANLDAIVFGHSHIPALVEAPSGGYYGNAGNWLTDTTYLRIDESGLCLCRWTGVETTIERATARRT